MNTIEDYPSDSSHDQLIQAYLDGEASPLQEEQFRGLLAQPSFCERLADFAIDFACLHELAQQGVLQEQPTVQSGASRSSRSRIWRVGLAAAASVLLAIAAFFLWSSVERPARQVAQPPALGHIQQATGTILSRDGNDGAPAKADTAFHSGEMFQTVGPESFAILVFHDGTKLALAAETTAVCTEDEARKKVTVRQGDVQAEVAPQPMGKPMFIVTPHAEVSVLGTRLSLSANTNSTKVQVAEGHVFMRRLSDGRSVDVFGGFHAVASAQSELIARPTPPVPDTWSEDFERGLPDGWQSGQWITEGLLDNSQGGVRATRRFDKLARDRASYVVKTHKAWTRGLFCIKEDTYLNFTYKLEEPQWFHLFISVRPDDLSQPHFGIYECRDEDWRKVPAGQWRTASVPVAEFRRVPKADFKDTPDFHPRFGDVAYMVIFRTPAKDRGLVIDRVWVTRGEPTD